VTPLPRHGTATRARLAIAIGIGALSVLGGLLLAAADLIRGSVDWAHHSPASAAPLFLIAAAIAAVSIGGQPKGWRRLVRLVAVLAFTVWGTAQVMPNPRTASALNDVAILLFVIDGCCAVIPEARAILARRTQAVPVTSPQPDPAAPLHDRTPNPPTRSCCGGLTIFGRELLNVCVKFQAARGRRARAA
jgi:hypothetical protein